MARGSTAHATLQFIRHTHGDVMLETILRRLDPQTRALIAGAAMTDELPYDALMSLWRSADESLREGDPNGWRRRARMRSIRWGSSCIQRLLRKRHRWSS
jgi:hypothetical protein